MDGRFGRARPGARGLEDLFSQGLLEDRNGDGLTDFVNARLVLGESPSPAVVAAASDVAARLGFETVAWTFAR